MSVDHAAGRCAQKSGGDIETSSAGVRSGHVGHLSRATVGGCRNHHCAAIVVAAGDYAIVHVVANDVAERAHFVAEDNVVPVGHSEVKVAVGVHTAGEAEVGTAAKEKIGVGEDAE